MRILLLTFACMGAFHAYSQAPVSTQLSAVVVGPDSLPLHGVAIINTRTGHTVRTNQNGFFQTEIAEDDSVFIYHIAFKRKFANESANGKIIVLELQINELRQVDVTDNTIKQLKNLEQTVKDIKRLAPMKKLTDYDMDSRQTRFIEQNGSHTKGFMPFFGPTVHVPVEKIITVVAGSDDKRLRKKLTSHYHLVKTKREKAK